MSELRSARIGMLLGVARPERVVSAVARRGIEPIVIVFSADHKMGRSTVERARRLGRKRAIGFWVATAKCRAHLPSHIDGVPVLVLQQELLLGPEASRTLIGGLGVPAGTAMVNSVEGPSMGSGC